MQIDARVERATRKMLSHAGRGELDALSETIKDLGDNKRYLECLELCIQISGYVAVDVLGPAWPTDAGLRQMAEGAVKAEDEYELKVDEVYDYLRKCAVGFQSIDQVFPVPEQAAIWPIVMTSSLLLSYRPKGKDVGEYLDEIEESLVAAASVEPFVLPGMILHAHRAKANRAK